MGHGEISTVKAKGVILLAFTSIDQGGAGGAMRGRVHQHQTAQDA
jgi:hypothetical protein